MKRCSMLFAAVAATTIAACTQGAEARPVNRADIGTGLAAAPVAPQEAGTTALRYEIAATGNAARYRVREQLVGRDLPNDAVGETRQIAGGISFDSAGAIVPAESRFMIGTAEFKSDSDRRDGYVRRRLLESERFPTVEFSPTAVRGVSGAAIAAAGNAELSFDLAGDLTIRGVTRPTTWRVTARRSAEGVTGSATTKFTFDDFGISQPRVSVVLSVADTIALEYDFNLTRADDPE